jgi:expansin (peptidoglycan-binding protein)
MRWRALRSVLVSVTCNAFVFVGTSSCGGGEGGGSGAANAERLGTPCAGAERRSGEATYYDFADGSGNCGFPATPDDLLVAAINHVDYAGSAACGTCVRIDGPEASVDVRIVDQCPECPEGNLDLSPEAFGRIADLAQGRVSIAWRYIQCPVSGPVVYHFKDGSNAFWTAVQLRNHRHAVASFAYQDDSGGFVDVPRLDYNYFVAESGMGPGPYTFRLTDVLGDAIEEGGIALADNAERQGSEQFSECAAE